MKKGEIHLVEVILVVLLFAATFPLLVSPYMPKPDWDYATTLIMGQDLAATLDRIPDGSESFLQNLMEKNTTYLKDFIESKFTWIKNRRMNFGMKTVGSLKNEVRIGFNCTSCDPNAEKEKIESTLKKSIVNGREINFYVFPFSYDRLFSHGIYMDVLLIFGDKQRNGEIKNRKDDVKLLLEKGVGVVGFYNISSLEWIEREIFGLTAVGGPGNENMSFTPSSPPNPNYDIQKYFYGVGVNGNFTYKWHESNETTITLWNNEYWFRRNDTNNDGSYDALDIDTNHDGAYELLGKKEGEKFSIAMGGKNFWFEIEKIDPEGKYFTLNFEKNPPYEFSNFLSGSSVTSDKGGNFVVVETPSGEAGVVVNGTLNSKWRAVWVCGGKGDDINALLKSSILWASKHEWWNVLRTVSGPYSKIPYFVSQGEEFHEPYWVEITLWHVY